MARVPTQDAPTVARQGLPNAQFDAAPDIAGQVAARQTAQIDRATGALVDTGFKIQADLLDQANQLRVDDALNQAREQAARLTYDKSAGYTNLKGKDALERPDGKALSDEYGGTLTQSLSGIASTLGNDRQRALFAQRTAPLVQGFRDRIMQHENNEFRTYATSVREGTIQNQLDEIGRNYSNPQAIDESVNSIRAATFDIAKMQGKSAEWAEAQARRMTSNAHFTAISAALQNNDPLYADQYMKKYAEQMDANDILRANGLITKEVDAKIGQAAGTQAMVSVQSSMAPTDFGRLTNLVMGQESGGRRYGADGKLLESPKGAKGEMQVLDSTNKNPGFGVRPAADDSPDERARVGRDYLQTMLQKYGGNVNQGLAAYNAGPGAVDSAIREANKNGTPAQWLNYLPKETQNYVASISRSYSSGGGTPSRPTLEDVHNRVRETLGPNASPDRLRIALETSTRQYTEQTAAIKQREDQALENAQRALIENGGNFAALPNDVRAAIPPGKFDDVMNFAGKLAAGVPIRTNWDLYYSLKRDPQVLAGTNLGSYRDKLSDTEFKQLVNEQQDLRQGKTDDLTRLRNGKEILNQFMREAGIDPTPKDSDKTGAATVGRIWNAFEQRVREREASTGKKLSPEEMKPIAAQIFTSVEVNRPFWFDQKTVAGAVAPGQRVVVPKEDRALIEQALRARGRKPTDDLIEQMYRQHKGIAPLANNG